MSETHYIYGLFDSVTGECRYVGRTDKPRERFMAHLRSARNASNKYIYGIPCPRDLWIVFCLNNGAVPIIKVFDECNESIVSKKEDEWIQIMLNYGNRLTNVYRIKGSGRLHNDYYDYTRCKKWGCRDMSRFDNYQGFPLVKPKQVYINRLKVTNFVDNA